MAGPKPMSPNGEQVAHVLAGLEQDVDHLGVLVDGPPEVLTLATNRHEEFVEMPHVVDRPGPRRAGLRSAVDRLSRRPAAPEKPPQVGDSEADRTSRRSRVNIGAGGG